MENTSHNLDKRRFNGEQRTKSEASQSESLLVEMVSNVYIHVPYAFDKVVDRK